MRSLVKRLIRWSDRSELEKDRTRWRLSLLGFQAKATIAAMASMVPMTLPYLLTLANTDKHQPNGHRYGHTYARYFQRFRYRRARLLEIGIGGYGYSLGGQSLVAWRAYFPFATIVGCDLHDKKGMGGWRIHVRQLDQSSPAELARLAAEEGPFDIIIDDGSHLSRHQISTFQIMFDALNDGGVYVVEDVMTSYWSFAHWDGAALGDLAFPETCMGWFTRLAHYLNYDDFEQICTGDAEMRALAPDIGHILFEKNIIVVQKQKGSKGAVSVERLKSAALAAAMSETTGDPRW